MHPGGLRLSATDCEAAVEQHVSVAVIGLQRANNEIKPVEYHSTRKGHRISTGSVLTGVIANMPPMSASDLKVSLHKLSHRSVILCCVVHRYVVVFMACLYKE